MLLWAWLVDLKLREAVLETWNLTYSINIYILTRLATTEPQISDRLAISRKLIHLTSCLWQKNPVSERTVFVVWFGLILTHSGPQTDPYTVGQDHPLNVEWKSGVFGKFSIILLIFIISLPDLVIWYGSLCQTIWHEWWCQMSNYDAIISDVILISKIKF